MNKASPEFDPYQPPVVVDSLGPEPQPDNHLQDVRAIGNAALVAISIQVLIKFLIVPVGPGILLTILTSLHVVAFLGSVVGYLMWLYRVCSNAILIDPDGDNAPGWAVGYYFIPLANLVAPIMTLRSVVRISFRGKDPGPLPVLVIVWWISFWCSILLLRYGTHPVGFILWCFSLVLSWGSVIILVTRISRCQSGFQSEPSR